MSITLSGKGSQLCPSCYRVWTNTGPCVPHLQGNFHLGWLSIRLWQESKPNSDFIWFGTMSVTSYSYKERIAKGPAALTDFKQQWGGQGLACCLDSVVLIKKIKALSPELAKKDWRTTAISTATKIGWWSACVRLPNNLMLLMVPSVWLEASQEQWFPAGTGKSARLCPRTRTDEDSLAPVEEKLLGDTLNQKNSGHRYPWETKNGLNIYWSQSLTQNKIFEKWKQSPVFLFFGYYISCFIHKSFGKAQSYLDIQFGSIWMGVSPRLASTWNRKSKTCHEFKY